MAKNIFRISGRVIDPTGQGVAGIRIVAWDKDLICNNFVGRINTDEHRQPDLFFRGRGE